MYGSNESDSVSGPRIIQIMRVIFSAWPRDRVNLLKDLDESAPLYKICPGQLWFTQLGRNNLHCQQTRLLRSTLTWTETDIKLIELN